MSLPRLAVLALVLLVDAMPGAARRPSGPPADAATCSRARLANGGKFMNALLRCAARAAMSGGKAPRACIKQGSVKFAKALKKIDRRGTCARDGLLIPSALLYTGYAEAVAGDVHPNRGKSRCDAAKLKVAGQAAEQLLAAVADARASLDMSALDAARSSVAAILAGGFGNAEQSSGCQNPGDALPVQITLEAAGGLAGTLLGHVQIAKTIVMPPDAQADAVANASTLQANGFTVSTDGSTLTGPSEGASGWIAELGDQRARLDANGGFTLNLPSGEPLEGKLYHPSDPTTAVARFFIVELTGGAEIVPTDIGLELAARGACGMNEDASHDPPSCHGFAAAAATRGEAHARAIEPATPQQDIFCSNLAQQGLFNPDPTAHPAMTNGDLGTYPNTDPQAQQCNCLDYDGYVQTGERGDSGVKGAIAFPGSTCAKQVLLQCCDNEAATIRRQILSVVDEYHFPILHCPLNHKGNRFCQSVTKGDLAVRVKGSVAHDGDTLEFTLQHGENATVTVHNNGCYGDTTVDASLFNSAGGVLTGARYDGEALHHWDVYGTYYADSDLTYLSNADCPFDGASDTYQFSVDDSEATVVFHCTPTTTTTTTCPGMENSCQTTTSSTTTTTTTETTTTTM